MARIGILGGTFDPPHNGHIAIAQAALEELHLDKIIFIPAALPPHKLSHRITSIDDRMAMLKLAIEGKKGFEISDMELKRPGPSYTVDTLNELRQLYPADSLFYIIGADCISEMETWYHPDEIIHMANVAAAERPGFMPAGKYKDKVTYFKMQPMDISSTQIRHRIKSGKSISDLARPGVEKYILERGLYKNNG